MRRVPLARRNLLAEPRRLVAGTAGVGLAVMLILLVGGLWNGMRAQASRYVDRQSAALYVAAPGSRTLFSDGSVLPRSTVEVVRATPGVDWAAPVWGLSAILDLHQRKVAVALVGTVPGQPGGAWRLASGRTPRSDDELAIDQVIADQHGLGVGSTVAFAGRTFRVVGFAADSSGFMVGYAFVTHDAVSSVLATPDRTSFVLVGTGQPETVRGRLAARGLNVLDRAQLRAANLELATRIFGKPLQLMVMVAFAAGALIIALTSYAQVAERRREYGIVKAMGATGRRLTVLALGQSLALAVLGLATGLGLFLAGRALIGWLRPQFEVLLTPGGLAQAVGAALLMALLAATIPARRLVRLDPATAYRGA